MAKASTHIAPGSAGYFSHNSRQSFSQSQVFFDEENEISSTKEEAFKVYRSELAARSDAYEKRVGQKLQNKTVTHLSAIVNLEQHHTLEDLKPLIDYLEKELDTKVTQVAIHRDEGKLVHKDTGEILTSGEQFFCNPENKKLYFDEEFEETIDMSKWNMEKNYHAHIEFMGLASDGKSIKRELTTYFFRKLQDKTAEVLKMERGQITKPTYTKEQMKEIKAELKPKKNYANDKAYGTAFTAIAKELGYWQPRPKRTKRKDTHDYKEDKAKENELNAKALAKQKDLKAEIARLRTELQSQNADRSSYAELEQLNRDLKERIKQKDLTLEEMRIKITTASETQTAHEEKIVILETELATEKTNIKELKTQIINQQQTISNKSSKITTLEAHNQALNAKIATLPTGSTIEELKTLKNDFKKLDSEYWELWELAYEDDYRTVLDDYGLPHDVSYTYKQLHEQSEEKVKELQTDMDEKINYIEELENGYSELEVIIYGKNKGWNIKNIIEDVDFLTKIMSNVSKYLDIASEKLIELFKDDIPTSREVQKESLSKIESSLSNEKNKKTFGNNSPSP